DFETGAAAEGLLYTYEATPRGTLFAGQVDIDDERFPKLAQEARQRVESGLALACAVGIGAMVTRGFGRMDFALIK
ncbi:MAG: type III-B CRISPR module RAMP protein Cmr4, partial [Gammaproteobacteria bacterium]